MQEKINILIVDDHPIIVNAYIQVLQQFANNNEKINHTNIRTAYGIDKAIEIYEKDKSSGFDLLILDISLPRSKKYNLNSGEDLGVYLKTKLSGIKIITITALNDITRIVTIIKSLNPDGFLIKCDLDNEILRQCLNNVLSGDFYYSSSITKLLNTRISNDIILDELDIRLLFELSNGSKMKDLQKLLPLTKSGLDKRRRILKMKFGLKSNSDRDLILAAKEKGFI